MSRTPSTAAALLTAAVLLAGCGGSAPDSTSDAAAPPSAAPSPTADPAAAWVASVNDLCTTLAGEVSGRQLSAGNDGKYTAAEVLSGEKAGRPAVEAFDAGLAALTAPPEAAQAEAALDRLLTRGKASVAPLLAAAEAGDQAAVNQAFAARERERLGPDGLASITAFGLPESCYFRTAFR